VNPIDSLIAGMLAGYATEDAARADPMRAVRFAIEASPSDRRAVECDISDQVRSELGLTP